MRKLAREICFKLIYENLFLKNNKINEASFHLLCNVEDVLNEEDQDFIKDLFNIYSDNKNEILSEINEHLIGYTFDRAYKIDIAIMSLAIAEFKYKKTDYKIVINEAAELAKKYSTEKSYKFINGLLASIVKEL